MNHKGKDVNSDWLAHQWDERSVLGHAQFFKGRMKGDDHEIDTAQTQKRFDGRLALLEKIRATFSDSILNKPSYAACCENAPDERLGMLLDSFILSSTVLIPYKVVKGVAVAVVVS